MSSFVLRGNIWTGDEKRPRARALRVENGKIVGVGAREEIVPRSGDEIYDFGDCTVTPGFTDSHLHFGAYARTWMYPDCSGAKSLEDLLDFLRDQVKKNESGAWLRVVNFVELNWEHPAVPTRLDLDAVAPDTPLLLSHYGGHFHVANTKAFERSGLWNVNSPEIERGADGLPAGRLIDSGADAMIKLIEASCETVEQLTKYSAAAIEKLSSMGITALHTSDAPSYALGDRPDILQDLDEAGRLPAHVFIYHDKLPNTLIRSRICLNGGHIAYAGLKLFADGSLGARTAALIEPYSDDAAERGRLLFSDGELMKNFREAQSRRIGVQIHAIGDAANEQVVRCIEKVQSELGSPEIPYRLNHAIVLTEDLPERIARAGIVVDLQPIQMWDDRNMAPARLASRLHDRAYQLRALADAGIVLTGSSDAPCDDPNPWWGIGLAATHRGLDGSLLKGQNEAQKLTLDEALTIYTANPWKSLGIDPRKAGILCPGAAADCAVADCDVFALAPEKICAVKNQATFFEGRKVF